MKITLIDLSFYKVAQLFLYSFLRKHNSCDVWGNSTRELVSYTM